MTIIIVYRSTSTSSISMIFEYVVGGMILNNFILYL